MIDLRLGKKPVVADDRDLKLATYTKDVDLPTKFPHKNFGNGTLFKNWGMLGNDEYGDCVIASRAHLTMLATSVGAPATARFTTSSVLATYSEVTGFDPEAGPPGDNPTDQGTEMRAMCRYQRTTGMVDADGNRHKIGAYLALEPGNALQAIQATWLFGGFCFGFEVPESCFKQFDAGEVWDVVKGAEVVGGHEVCAVGTMDYQGRLTIVTWGLRQEMTFDFLHAYNDESYAYVNPEILDIKGKWRGLNIEKLNEDLSAL